jgi:hypothetical protein
MILDARGAAVNATIRALTASALMAGLLFGGPVVYAQSGPTDYRMAAREATMSFDVPEQMTIEHEELHAALAALTKVGGRTGEAARAVAEVLEPHFAKENEYALPPLSLLLPLSQGKFEPAMTEVLKLTDKLEAEMPAMLSEHKEIAAALKKLQEAATAENNTAGVRFAEHLAAHAREEEETTYPTALLIGKYLKLRAAQSAR